MVSPCSTSAAQRGTDEAQPVHRPRSKVRAGVYRSVLHLVDAGLGQQPAVEDGLEEGVELAGGRHHATGGPGK